MVAVRAPSGRGPIDTTARRLLRGTMVVFYAAAGIAHVAVPAGFLPIMPDWVPFPVAVIMVTGACEIAGACGLMSPRWRWWAGVMLAVYAVCVFPANIKHAVYNIDVPQLPKSWWYHGPRLLAQPVLVWWALYGAAVIDWPFRRRAQPGANR